MLAKANRITRGADYKAVVRRGSRVSAPNLVMYVSQRSSGNSAVGSGARFGFIVSKTVGSAPIRNTVRRRLKAIAYELLPETPASSDIVVRALPASAQAPWSTLHDELSRVMHRVGTR